MAKRDLLKENALKAAKRVVNQQLEEKWPEIFEQCAEGLSHHLADDVEANPASYRFCVDLALELCPQGGDDWKARAPLTYTIKRKVKGPEADFNGTEEFNLPIDE